MTTDTKITITGESLTDEGFPVLDVATAYGPLRVTVLDGNVSIAATPEAPLRINRIDYHGRTYAELYERGEAPTWRTTDRYWRRVGTAGGSYGTMTEGAADVLYTLVSKRIAPMAYTPERVKVARLATLQREIERRRAKVRELDAEAAKVQAEAAYIEAEIARDADDRPFRVRTSYTWNDHDADDETIRAASMLEVCAIARKAAELRSKARGKVWRNIDVWRLYAENVDEPTQYSRAHETITNYDRPVGP